MFYEKEKLHVLLSCPHIFSLPPGGRGKTQTPNKLLGVLARPVRGRLVVHGAVGAVEVRNLGDERIVRVRVREKRANRKQHLGDGQGRRPVVLEDVKADTTLVVDVAVVDLGLEADLGRLERTAKTKRVGERKGEGNRLACAFVVKERKRASTRAGRPRALNEILPWAHVKWAPVLTRRSTQSPAPCRGLAKSPRRRPAANHQAGRDRQGRAVARLPQIALNFPAIPSKDFARARTKPSRLSLSARAVTH